MTLDHALDKVTWDINAISDREAVALLNQLHAAGATSGEMAGALAMHREWWAIARREGLAVVRAVWCTGTTVH